MSALPALALTLAPLLCTGQGHSTPTRPRQAVLDMVQNGPEACPFQARLTLVNPERLALQEEGGGQRPGSSWEGFQEALKRYQGQWTFLLTISPKPGAKPIQGKPLSLDVENNGGTWGDWDRNLHRLMFEMGAFIHLNTKDGKRVDPLMVQYQRTFGEGTDRSFLLLFPKADKGQAVTPPFSIHIEEFGQALGPLEFKVTAVPRPLEANALKSLWESMD